MDDRTAVDGLEFLQRCGRRGIVNNWEATLIIGGSITLFILFFTSLLPIEGMVFLSAIASSFVIGGIVIVVLNAVPATKSHPLMKQPVVEISIDTLSQNAETAYYEASDDSSDEFRLRVKTANDFWEIRGVNEGSLYELDGFHQPPMDEAVEPAEYEEDYTLRNPGTIRLSVEKYDHLIEEADEEMWRIVNIGQES